MSTEIQQAEAHVETSSCLCPACVGTIDPNAYDVTIDASLDPRAGGTANNKPIWTPERIAEYLNRTGGGYANTNRDLATDGRQNNIGDGNDVITFGFFNTIEQVYRNGYTYTANNSAGVPTLFGLAEAFNFAPFTEAQRAAAREAFQYWDDVIAVSFREVSADDADMNLANLASAPQTQAYARIPTAGLDSTLGGQVREIGGDSWYSASQASNFQLDEGLYGLNTLTHEIGHGLGLSHPGAYNFGPGFAVTYANGAEYAQDARNYSIMSYWNPRDLGTAGGDIATRDFDWSLMSIAYGATPMVHDILAIQRIYGADMTTRTGDTTYGFNVSGADIRDAHDFTKTPWPTMAIWDAGGTDTLDASGYNVNQTINLTPGSLSSIGGVTYEEALRTLTFEQVNANRAAAGLPPVARATYDANMAALAAQPDFRGRLTDNVGIAYGAIIENAVGGGGNDTIIGNAADNRLTGNAGNDTMTGAAGADTLLGGAGNDILAGGAGADILDGGEGIDYASYRDAAAGVTVTVTNNGSVTVSGDGVGDQYISIEGFEGSNFADVLTGGSLGDTFLGGGGDDRIEGDSGADTLRGGAGNDTLDGGNDADTLFGDAGNDQLKGGNEADTLNGGEGDDTLFGNNDGDTLFGDAGNDTLDGGNGTDVLNGGAGNDRLSGGTGNDVFRFTETGGNDVITDFRRGSDKIDLSGLDANSGAAGTQAFSFVGANVFTNTAGELRTYSEGGSNFLAGDVDGDGKADFTINLGNVVVNQTDIILVA